MVPNLNEKERIYAMQTPDSRYSCSSYQTKKVAIFKELKGKEYSGGRYFVEEIERKGTKEKKGKGTCMVVSDLWLQVIER